MVGWLQRIGPGHGKVDGGGVLQEIGAEMIGAEEIFIDKEG